jgi:predicted Rossmann-fold nucleotide-binding protein
MLDAGMISPHDLDLLKFTDDPAEALAHVKAFAPRSGKAVRPPRQIPLLGEKKETAPAS